MTPDPPEATTRERRVLPTKESNSGGKGSKPWQQTYQVTQAALDIHDDPVVTTRSLRPCRALAPESGVKTCQKAEYCQQVAGHPGQCAKRITECNRPAGHEGPHTFLVLNPRRGYEQLAGWT